MATMTVLEMTQEILSSLDSDDVNSIGDTVESMQVARILKRKYYDILARGSLPEQDVLFQLVASGDTGKPVLMTPPTGCSRINWIKYFDSNPQAVTQEDQFGSFSHDLNTDIVNNTTFETTSTTSQTIGTGSMTFVVASSGLPIQVGTNVTITADATDYMLATVTAYTSTNLTVNVYNTSGSGTFNSWTITDIMTTSVPGYKYVTVLPIDQFIDYVNRFGPTENNVALFEFTEHGYDFRFYYKNDASPRFCTIIENSWIIFDSYDNTVDSTLQGSKTMVYGQVVTPFTMSDTFVPDLDDQQFPLLLNEAKMLAWFELKQMAHPVATQEVQRQWSVVQKNKSISNKPTYFNQLADFGRVPRTGGFASGGYGAYKWMRQAGP